MAESSKAAEAPQQQGPASSPPPGSSTVVPNEVVHLQHSVPTNILELAQANPQALDIAMQKLTGQNEHLLAVNEAQKAVIKAQQHTIDCQNEQMDSYRVLMREEVKLRETGFRKHDNEITPILDQLRIMYTSPAEAATAGERGGLWTPTKVVSSTEETSERSRKRRTPFWERVPDQKPTRVFNDAWSRKAAGLIDASNASRQTDENKKHSGPASTISGPRVGGSAALGSLRHGASVPGHLISKNYDSIPLKPKGLVTDEFQRLADWNSADPVLFESSSSHASPPGSSQVSPRSRPKSFSRGKSLSPPGGVDLTLKDAGHTPPVRTSLLSKLTSLDGPASDGGSGSTPKGDVEETPLETPTALQEPIRQPRGPPPGLEGQSPDDGDVPLTGPLNLTNSPDNDQNTAILGEIDKRLTNVNLTEAAGNVGSPVPSTLSGDPSKSSQTNIDPDLKNVDGSVCETPEPEPPIRLKKDTNFASLFGKGNEVDYGKGFAKRDP